MPPVSEVEIAAPKEGAGGLSRSDCLCPVCLEIFLEPVTLPCSHTFCKSCFLETVDKSNMCCPLCRKRVSTWARLNSRNKTLVNKDLWQRIQNAFPEQCQRRLSGQEDDYSTCVLLFKFFFLKFQHQINLLCCMLNWNASGVVELQLTSLFCTLLGYSTNSNTQSVPAWRTAKGVWRWG